MQVTVSKKKIFVFGCGGHAKSCIEVINSTKLYDIASIVYNEKPPKINFFSKYKLVKENNLKQKYQNVNAIVGVGQIKDNSSRKKIFNLCVKKKFKLDSICSSNSTISVSSKIGLGTIVMHFVMIGPDSKIGSNCIINSGSIIEHDVSIGNHCHISTGCILNGGVKIGNDSFIGSGTVIKEGVVVKPGSIIPMGSTVRSNV